MKAFVILSAVIVLASAGDTKTKSEEGRSKRGFWPGTASYWGTNDPFSSYGTGNTNGYSLISKTGSGLYGSGWRSAPTWSSNYASNYGYGKGSINNAYIYPAPLIGYGRSAYSYEYDSPVPSYRYYSVPSQYYRYSSPAYKFAYSVPSYRYSYTTPSYGYSAPIPSPGYGFSTASQDYIPAYPVATKTFTLTPEYTGPSTKLLPSVSYNLPSVSYVQQPAYKVVNVKKVVNVQREVVVPQVIQVKKIITEPKVITEQQVVPVSTGYYNGYGKGFSNTYASTGASSGHSVAGLPSTSQSQSSVPAVPSVSSVLNSGSSVAAGPSASSSAFSGGVTSSSSASKPDSSLRGPW